MAVLLILVAVCAGGALLATRPGRGRSSRAGTTFPCRYRPAGRSGGARPARWSRSRRRGAWAHDVLLLKRDGIVPAVTALPVRMPAEGLRDARRGEVRGLGRDPVVVLLRLDDDRLVEVAARREHRVDLAGPFVAAVIPTFPRGPRERPLGR